MSQPSLTAQPDAARPPAARRLWLGLLGPPCVWLAHFLALWVIAEWGCLAGWAPFTIMGVQAITVLLVAATCAALPLVIAAGLLSWRSWRQARAGAHDRATEDRSAYMGFGGAALSVLFGFAILLESVPALLLRPC